MKINLAFLKLIIVEFLDEHHFHIKFYNGILIYLEISKSCFSFCNKKLFSYVREKKYRLVPFLDYILVTWGVQFWSQTTMYTRYNLPRRTSNVRVIFINFFMEAVKFLMLYNTNTSSTTLLCNLIKCLVTFMTVPTYKHIAFRR